MAAWDLTFTSFASFGAYLGTAKRRIPKAIKQALAGTSENLLDRIQSKFGVYQDAVGPFPAWEPLKTATLERRERRGINAEDQPLLESGELQASYQIAMQGNNSVVGSDAEQALVQEVGDMAHNIPPRPVVGPALYEYEEEHFKVFEELYMGWLLQGRPFRRLRSRTAMLKKGSFGYGSGATMDVTVED